MSNSSAQQDYSTGLSQAQIDTLTTTSVSSIDLSSIPTITWDNCSTNYGSVGTITLSSGVSTSGSCYTINTGAMGSTCYASSGGTFTIDTTSIFGNIEWVNGFPEWSRIHEMCKEYPALKIAFEKFKNTYNLVKDDYDAPPEKRIKP